MKAVSLPTVPVMPGEALTDAQERLRQRDHQQQRATLRPDAQPASAHSDTGVAARERQPEVEQGGHQVHGRCQRPEQ